MCMHTYVHTCTYTSLHTFKSIVLCQYRMVMNVITVNFTVVGYDFCINTITTPG